MNRTHSPQYPILFLKWEQSHISAKKFTDEIANFIVKGLHPYSIVDEQGFRDMTEEAQPRYAIPNLPNRTTFSRSVVPKLYENCKSRLKEMVDNDMQDIQSISITTDSYTSRASDSYL
ncbi:hypothetical protein PR048_001240 [Dryococelus australis]|uniref:Uncharacterized protein n=1 Tax=Dryococelus australis TaxID=614101 RepID=A0ABQ9IIA2_9NEOP|nr:hypothetical protein PR048_001240 [Dryococelus australis]